MSGGTSRGEELLGRLTSREQAACFDVGVEHGVAAARVERLQTGPKVRRLTDSLVREILGTNVSRQDIEPAAEMVAWAVFGRRDVEITGLVNTPTRD